MGRSRRPYGFRTFSLFRVAGRVYVFQSIGTSACPATTCVFRAGRTRLTSSVVYAEGRRRDRAPSRSRSQNPSPRVAPRDILVRYASQETKSSIVGAFPPRARRRAARRSHRAPLKTQNGKRPLSDQRKYPTGMFFARLDEYTLRLLYPCFSSS